MLIWFDSIFLDQFFRLDIICNVYKKLKMLHYVLRTMTQQQLQI